MTNETFFSNLLVKKQTSCPCCLKKLDKKKIKKVINLPKYPITEFYRSSNSRLIKKSKIDQSVIFCKFCDHMFLQNILDVNKIYKNYITSSSSSRGAVACLENFYSFIKKYTKNLNDFNLVDIGGNDSTFLNMFTKHHKLKINVDPNATSKNNKIILKNVFLENLNFEKILKTKEKVVYCSSHTLEHLENPILLLKNLSKILKKNDEIYLQFPSLESLVSDMRFDQICHQHINYFSLKSVSKTLKKLNLYIHNYEYDNSHFGTLRIKVSKLKNKKSNLLFQENLLNNLELSYKSFKDFYNQLNKSLKGYFNKGQGYGAGLMVPILAYYLPIINELEYIIDENPEKYNKKFINLRPLIKNISSLKINKPILITSISTKAAGRQIFNKLLKNGINDICIPAMVI